MVVGIKERVICRPPSSSKLFPSLGLCLGLRLRDGWWLLEAVVPDSS